MKLDFATFAFGYKVLSGGGTPNWATSLGQGKDYKINNIDDVEELLKGIIYSSVPLGNITTKIGKGGKTIEGNSVDSPIVLASLFNKVYLNDTLIKKGRFILLITRDDSESHSGRLRLKYGPSNAYSENGNIIFSNHQFNKLVSEQFGLADNACWFVYEISIKNQDELHMSANFVNKNNMVEYNDTVSLHKAWQDFFNNDHGSTETMSLPSKLRNLIFFGAPGTGKSFNLNKDKYELISSEDNYERVTFHPDYSYANFVGCYKPIMRENNYTQMLDSHQKDVFEILQDNSKTAQEKYDILYEKFKNNGEGLTRIPILLGLYCDGDFTMKKTDGTDAANSSVEKNHGKAIRPYVTLLSEKNTDEIAYEYIPGPFMRILVKALKNPQENYLLIIEEINRANIAGVFGDVFQLLDRDNNGNSEYEIQTSEDMRKYLKKELAKDMPTIRIPSNMYIWATMNSADQGVFPMDTAFKRRWNFKYFDIDNGEETIQDKVVEICGESINWNRLRKAINNELSNNKINEDKLMGAHFLPESVLEDHEKFINAFKNKVIMYLFEDAAKQKRSTIFSGCSNNLRFSSICKEFDVNGIQIFSENIQHDTKE